MQPAFTPNTEGIWLDLPAETYHKAPGVSQSMLKDFDDHATPAHFKAAPPKKATEDMVFGTVCHTAILEPARLAASFHLRPESYPDAKGKEKAWHGGADWCKTWLAAHQDKPVLQQAEANKLEKIVAAVMRLPEFAAALNAGQREISYFKRDPHTGLLLKCRCDVMAAAEDGVTWIFDLKKVQVGGGSFEDFQKSVMDYGYHIQAASYLQITGATRFVFVPFDDDVPFGAIQWELDDDALAFGRAEYRRILNDFAECYKSDVWPGYRDGIAKLALPHWAKKKLREVYGDE